MTRPPLRTLGRLAVAGGVVAAVGLAVLLVAPGLVGAEATYVVESGSMEPAIGAGDVVVVGSADASALSEGAVVTYRSPEAPGTVVTHRIVAVEETGDGVRYRTKGDANEEPDEYRVAPSHVVGTVWFAIPAVGHLVAFAGTDLGLLALVVLPALLLIAGELYDLYRYATSVRDADHSDHADGAAGQTDADSGTGDGP